MQMLTPQRPITVYAKPILEQMTVIEDSVGTFFFMRIFTLVIENQIGFQGFTHYCPPASVKKNPLMTQRKQKYEGFF